ncbi:hypothetical protein ACILFN_06415 [Capnocytophaga canimorsus]|uniref:hypothetical protein n=1 Tax=Capnocytophaga canimorsus TaxID=28188 RepID=UPI001561CFB2|nr:hypothetical protein [Capnocytophaga canimorsus]
MVKILQLHKRASYEFKYIQDKYALNTAHTCFALADGTTQSFNSERWAEIITSEFVKKPLFQEQELINLFTQSVSLYKNTPYEFSSNTAKAALEKAKMKMGGTATFVGVEAMGKHQFQIISCGDTNVFQIGKNNMVEAFPYTSVDDLDANNHFINTEKLLEQKIDASFFRKKTISINSTDVLIIATDALSRLFLKDQSTIRELLQISDFEQLHLFCLKYWEDKKQLEEDDISAIVISSDGNMQKQIIVPPTDFSFPKEEEVEFIPTSLQPNNNSQKQTEEILDMQEIRQNFNAVANDFNLVKKQLKFHQMLNFSILGILSIMVIAFLLLSPIDKLDKLEQKIESLESQFKNIKTDIKDLEQKIGKKEDGWWEQIISKFSSSDEELKKEIKQKVQELKAIQNTELKNIKENMGAFQVELKIINDKLEKLDKEINQTLKETK